MRAELHIGAVFARVNQLMGLNWSDEFDTHLWRWVDKPHGDLASIEELKCSIVKISPTVPHFITTTYILSFYLFISFNLILLASIGGAVAVGIVLRGEEVREVRRQPIRQHQEATGELPAQGTDPPAGDLLSST